MKASRTALIAALLLVSPAAARHAPVARDLGIAEGTCRADEPGPAVLADVRGLKDRRGLLRMEVYPPEDGAFLGDSAELVRTGQVFRRIEETAPPAGPVELCIRLPAPGTYSLVVVHDRESNHKFSWWEDGVGFPGNPRLGWHKPRAREALLVAGAGLTRIGIVLNYRHGLGMAPLKHGE